MEDIGMIELIKILDRLYRKYSILNSISLKAVRNYYYLLEDYQSYN